MCMKEQAGVRCRGGSMSGQWLQPLGTPAMAICGGRNAHTGGAGDSRLHGGHGGVNGQG